MALTEQQMIDFTNNLIANPNTDPNQIPEIVGKLAATFSTAFPAAVVEQPKKKRRRGGGNQGAKGWPQGVTRSEYLEWKDSQVAAGVTDNLNPHAYKAQRDGLPMPAPTLALTPNDMLIPDPLAGESGTVSATVPAEAESTPAPAGEPVAAGGKAKSTEGKPKGKPSAAK